MLRVVSVIDWRTQRLLTLGQEQSDGRRQFQGLTEVRHSAALGQGVNLPMSLFGNPPSSCSLHVHRLATFHGSQLSKGTRQGVQTQASIKKSQIGG